MVGMFKMAFSKGSDVFRHEEMFQHIPVKLCKDLFHGCLHTKEDFNLRQGFGDYNSDLEVLLILVFLTMSEGSDCNQRQWDAVPTPGAGTGYILRNLFTYSSCVRQISVL